MVSCSSYKLQHSSHFRFQVFSERNLRFIQCMHTLTANDLILLDLQENTSFCQTFRKQHEIQVYTSLDFFNIIRRWRSYFVCTSAMLSYYLWARHCVSCRDSMSPGGLKAGVNGWFIDRSINVNISRCLRFDVFVLITTGANFYALMITAPMSIEGSW